jgi:hypothetical protein
LTKQLSASGWSFALARRGIRGVSLEGINDKDNVNEAIKNRNNANNLINANNMNATSDFEHASELDGTDINSVVRSPFGCLEHFSEDLKLELAPVKESLFSLPSNCTATAEDPTNPFTAGAEAFNAVHKKKGAYHPQDKYTIPNML